MEFEANVEEFTFVRIKYPAN